MSNFVEQINQHKEKGLYRQRNFSHNARIFCDNDYLGLAKDKRILQAFKEGADEYGIGGASSQLVVGHQPIHRQLECAFADFLQREAALLFTTGYMANCGVMNALVGRGDTVFADKYIHASLIDAVQLSGATLKRFPHMSYAQLENALKQQKTGKKVIVTDSVFSLRGDVADLSTCATLAEKYQATLMVDDAHGIGILAAAGAAEFFQLSQEQLPVLVCPLAKAFGGMGAIVAGSHALIDYLIQFARSYMYTTAIPPAFAKAALAALEIIKAESWRRDQLQERITYFQSLAKDCLPLLSSNTPIQCLYLSEATQLSDYLATKGFLVSAIRPPSVPIGESCLRITITLNHTHKEIEALFIAIKGWYDTLS